MHSLLNRISPQTLLTQLPPNPTLLHPSKRNPAIPIITTIDPNHPRLQPPRHTMSLRDVSSENRRSQPIDGIIRKLNRLGLAAERRNTHEGPEDFFAENAHRGLHVAENGGGDEEVFSALLVSCR